MKTIDTKSLLLGVIATALILTLTSSISSEGQDLSFFGYPYGVGLYNKTTNTLYLYKQSGLSAGVPDKPSHIYKIADDGSSLTKKD